MTRLWCVEPLFENCAFCGNRPMVEVVEGEVIRYQVRCSFANGHGSIDRAGSLQQLRLMWASSQDRIRQWRENDLLI